MVSSSEWQLSQRVILKQSFVMKTEGFYPPTFPRLSYLMHCFKNPVQRSCKIPTYQVGNCIQTE